MKCPKCGKTVKNDAKFCFACGAKLEQPKVAEAEKIEVQHVKMKPETPKVKKKGKGKKIGKFVIAVGVCIAVVVAGVNIAPHLTQTDNPCIYASNGIFSLLNRMKKGSGIEFSDGVTKASSVDEAVKFSPNGKYLYFYTNYDSYESRGSLCRVRWDKIKNDSIKNQRDMIEVISTDAQLGVQFISDDEVVYKESTNSLFYYDGKESVKIAKQASYFDADENGRIIYMRANNEENDSYTLYGITASYPDDKKKLASNISWIWSSADFDNIFFYVNGSEDESILGVAGFDNKFQILGKNATVFSHGDDWVYYLNENGESLNLYDYVEGTEDLDNLKEPVPEDYQITRDKYEMIGEGTVVEDYEELYTSCTQESMFMPDGENMEDQPEVEFQDFVKKYKKLENEDGYIQLTDEIKDELKKLAALYGEGYENEWLELCFGKKTEIVTDEEAYNEARDKYDRLRDSEYLCENLKDENNAFPLKNLYYYKDGEVSEISKDVAFAEGHDNALAYNTKDMLNEKMKLEDINEWQDVQSLFALNYEKQNHLIRISDGKILQMSTEGGKFWKKQMDAGWGEITFVGDNVFINCEDGEMGIASVSEDKIGSFETIAEKAKIMRRTEEELYYAEADDDYYYDLYCFKDGDSSVVACDITMDAVSGYEDGKVVASTTPKNDNGYELSISESSGSMKYIADDVSDYLRLDSDCLLYISDGDLYFYDGKDKELIAYDVDNMWSMKSMESKYNYFGYYGYYSD